MADVTSKIRDRLLAIANKIFLFVDTHESYMKPYVNEFLTQCNIAIQKIPHYRAFKLGAKRVIKDGKIVEIKKDNKEMSDDSLNVDESMEVDNRMSGDKVLRILRDFIIKENKHIKDALEITGITSDHVVSRQNLKEAIKKITGAQASYDEINKALDHFHSVSLEKKQDKQMGVNEPGQNGYTLNRVEGQNNFEQELKSNKINFKDVEMQLKDVLKRAGYKAPTQQKERMNAEE
jgi:hypothetical protein